eukprot:3433630-Alexandrium_andersonii.AAC.1
MSASLVGSEMCIRDSRRVLIRWAMPRCCGQPLLVTGPDSERLSAYLLHTCLLYTSDAADDM